MKKKVVILGAGFAGIYTFLSLTKRLSPDEVDVLVIDKTNYFLFTPMLHEVATGGLSHHQVVESIREIIYKSKANLLVAEAAGIDLTKKSVTTNIGEVPFDYLVIAVGATTNFYEIHGVEKHAFVLKDLAGAIKLRNHFISVFEKASQVADKEERQRMLSFTVVGGGPTGVELVAEMADLFYNTFEKFYRQNICEGDVSIHLVDSGPQLLPQFDEALHKKALHTLTKKKVHVYLNTSVVEVTPESIRLHDGSSIATRHLR